MPSGSPPDSVNASVWQIPVAFISTSTSPAFGPSRSTSAISSGLPASTATAARTFIGLLLRFVALLPTGSAGGRDQEQAEAGEHRPPPGDYRPLQAVVDVLLAHPEPPHPFILKS